MDKEICDKHYRVVGMFQALESMSKQVYCMPGDKTTAVLLDSIQGLLCKAVVSSWDYAEQRTAEGKRGSENG